MGLIDAMTLSGALKVLGHHHPAALERLDRMLGGVISGGTPIREVLAPWDSVDRKNEVISLLRTLWTTASDPHVRLVGHRRVELITATHTVLAASALIGVAADFLSRHTAVLGRLRPKMAQSAAEFLFRSEVPIPWAACGFRAIVSLVEDWGAEIIDAVLGSRSVGDSSVRDDLSTTVADNYRWAYLRVAAQVPEFAVWVAFAADEDWLPLEIDRLRDDIRAALVVRDSALLRLESLLMLVGGAPGPTRHPLLDESLVVDEATRAEPGGVRFPSVREIYQQPHYRLVRMAPGIQVSNEQFWCEQSLHRDLDLLLAAHFTSPEATRMPLVVLGHPGAGKSLLTRVVSARLPASSFTAVLVPLRQVSANAPVWEQVDQAVRRDSHGRHGWASLCEERPDTTVVVLLDGLDELLQAAEKDRTAYLAEVVDFQRRSAELSRPVVVVVTSRTLVADRVDVPTDVAIVRLEVFDQNQVEQWRTRWNDANHDGIGGGRVRALSLEATAAQPDLVCQPLLLLLLALYSADPSFPPIDSATSTTTLYRRLLEGFALRESGKPVTGDPADQIHRLSIVALAMFNRSRQHVSDSELGSDLAALADGPSHLRIEDAAQAVVSRFFFVHTAQAVLGGGRNSQSYEFLHATFGEYLVAREVVEVLRDTAASTIGRRGFQDPDDDLLHALLSHDALAVRESIPRFLGDLLGELPDEERLRITSTLDVLLASYRSRRGGSRYEAYRPTPVDHLRDMAAYSANLVLLRVLIATREVPPGWPAMVAGWRAGLSADSRQAMLTAVQNRQGVLQLRSFDWRAANVEVLDAELAGDQDHALTVLMGLEIRSAPTFPRVEADLEHQLRWLVALLAFGTFTTAVDVSRLKESFGYASSDHRVIELVERVLEHRARAIDSTALDVLVDYLYRRGGDPALLALLASDHYGLSTHPGLARARTADLDLVKRAEKLLRDSELLSHFGLRPARRKKS
ncbi:hypothetical protein [Actinosynnema sp. NPDC020468]|uniref:NACHT domain-containing protein n=1 Tax=Actinosynnema sp. NPDC020468 TaxID=3154488 RepID=UPI0033EF8AFB